MHLVRLGSFLSSLFSISKRNGWIGVGIGFLIFPNVIIILLHSNKILEMSFGYRRQKNKENQTSRCFSRFCFSYPPLNFSGNDKIKQMYLKRQIHGSFYANNLIRTTKRIAQQKLCCGINKIRSRWIFMRQAQYHTIISTGALLFHFREDKCGNLQGL